MTSFAHKERTALATLAEHHPNQTETGGWGDVGGGVQVPLFRVLGQTFDLDSGTYVCMRKAAGETGETSPIESLPHFCDKKAQGGTCCTPKRLLRGSSACMKMEGREALKTSHESRRRGHQKTQGVTGRRCVSLGCNVLRQHETMRAPNKCCTTLCLDWLQGARAPFAGPLLLLFAASQEGRVGHWENLWEAGHKR